MAVASTPLWRPPMRERAAAAPPRREMRGGREEGRKEGREEGREGGREGGRASVVRVLATSHGSAGCSRLLLRGGATAVVVALAGCLVGVVLQVVVMVLQLQQLHQDLPTLPVHLVTE